MEATAKLKYARISPQKCRLVADTVRGAQVSKALNTLKFMPKKGADLVHKVLWSAVENAQNNQGLDIDDLKVTRIMVDAAPQFKRFRSEAQVRAHLAAEVPAGGRHRARRAGVEGAQHAQVHAQEGRRPGAQGAVVGRGKRPEQPGSRHRRPEGHAHHGRRRAAI